MMVLQGVIQGGSHSDPASCGEMDRVCSKFRRCHRDLKPRPQRLETLPPRKLERLMEYTRDFAVYSWTLKVRRHTFISNLSRRQKKKKTATDGRDPRDRNAEGQCVGRHPPNQVAISTVRNSLVPGRSRRRRLVHRSPRPRAAARADPGPRRPPPRDRDARAPPEPHTRRDRHGSPSSASHQGSGRQFVRQAGG